MIYIFGLLGEKWTEEKQERKCLPALYTQFQQCTNLVLVMHTTGWEQKNVCTECGN